MIRQLIFLVVVVTILASGARQGSAQSPEPTPASRTENLAEADRLGKQADQLAEQSKFAEAVPLAERVLSLREQELGPMHPDVAAALNGLGELEYSKGEYRKAEPHYLRALEIREKVLGSTHPDVGDTLNNLGDVYLALGEYGRAMPLLTRALRVLEKAPGPVRPGLVAALTNLAGVYLEQGAYAKAESLFARALDLDEKAKGLVHPTLAKDLNNLAGVYNDQGAYAKAEPLFIRALEIREKTLGPMHPDTASSLNNLGYLYFRQAAYAKAEPFLVRAVDVRERALGPMHPVLAASLNNLALLYSSRGERGKAEPLFLRSLDILEKSLGPKHPRFAGALANLAVLYTDQGAYEKAEPLFLRALDIDEKAQGPVHITVAKTLNKLARLYVEQGAYGKAEPLYLRALDIWEKTVGMHPDMATCLGNLAALYTDQGAYGKAEPLYLRALRTGEQALGPMHPDLVKNLYGLARLYRAQGAPERAQPLLSRAAEIREAQLRTELARLSEPARRALMTTLRDETGSVVSFHADAMPTSARALDLALTTVLRRKGRILDSLAETQVTLRGHLTPRLRAQLDQLAQARTELSERLYSQPDRQSAADRAAAIAASRTRVEGLEAALGAASLEFRAQSAPITVAKVQAALPRGAMLVEFVRYQRFAAARVQQRSQPDRYVAYLLTRQGPPRWVELGDAAPIDAAVDAALAALHRAPTPRTSDAALQALDALVLGPLRAQLADASHLILAPDGKLNLVPFEALVDPQGHFEVEQRLMSYVTSGRDLLRRAAPRAPRSPAVIVASPDYGPLPSTAAPGTVSFAPLAGAAAEVDQLRPLFPAAPLTGAAATKHALADLVGPAILHVATHGFYTRDPGTVTGPVPAPAIGRASPAVAQRGIVVHGGNAASQPQPPDDPLDALDQAGLAMAGANQGADGIVTAREIAGFDWWGTKLVVLSACETGVGAVPSGDGVYGLRRAVVLAGAEAQVVSLWNVNDSSAQELMRAYYDELVRGTGRAEAIRQAKLRLLRQPRYAHPHYWAAFILAGDWTPLDKSVLQPRRSVP